MRIKASESPGEATPLLLETRGVPLLVRRRMWPGGFH